MAKKFILPEIRVINGRKMNLMEVDYFSNAPRYRKIAAVHALQSIEPGIIETLEGNMEFHSGDYLVTDDPPTHIWPVRQDIFEATYEELERSDE